MIQELITLLSENYNFVQSWKDPSIIPDVFRAYGKKQPANEASLQYINQTKSQLQDNQYYISVAEDFEKSQHSLEDWKKASKFTTERLNNLVKEPEYLLLFKGGVYECTYN